MHNIVYGAKKHATFDLDGSDIYCQFYWLHVVYRCNFFSLQVEWRLGKGIVIEY
jgi:hypothetical protein